MHQASADMQDMQGFLNSFKVWEKMGSFAGGIFLFGGGNLSQS